MKHMPEVRVEKNLMSAIQSLGENEVLQISAESLVRPIIITWDLGRVDSVEYSVMEMEEQNRVLKRAREVVEKNSVRELSELVGVFLLKEEPKHLKELRGSVERSKGKLPEDVERAMLEELSRIELNNLCLVVRDSELEQVVRNIKELEEVEVRIKKLQVVRAFYEVMGSIEKTITGAQKYSPSRESLKVIEVAEKRLREKLETPEANGTNIYGALVSLDEEKSVSEIRFPMEFVPKYAKNLLHNEKAKENLEKWEGLNNGEMWEIIGREEKLFVITSKSPYYFRERKSSNIVVIAIELEPPGSLDYQGSPGSEEDEEIILIPIKEQIKESVERVGKMWFLKAVKRKVSGARADAKIEVEKDKFLLLEIRNENEKDEKNERKSKELELIKEGYRKRAEIWIDSSVNEFKIRYATSKENERQTKDYIDKYGIKFEYEVESEKNSVGLESLTLRTESDEDIKVSLMEKDGERTTILKKENKGENENASMRIDLVYIKEDYTVLAEELAAILLGKREFFEKVREGIGADIKRATEEVEKRREDSEEEKRLIKWSLEKNLKTLKKILEHRRITKGLETKEVVAKSVQNYYFHISADVATLSLNQKQEGRALTKGIDLSGPDKLTSLIRLEDFPPELCFRSKEGESVPIDAMKGHWDWKKVENRVLGEEEMKEVEKRAREGMIPEQYLAALLLLADGTINANNLPEDNITGWEIYSRILDYVKLSLYRTVGMAKLELAIPKPETPEPEQDLPPLPKEVKEEWERWEREIVPVLKFHETTKLEIEKRLDKEGEVRAKEIAVEVRLSEGGYKIDLGGGNFLRVSFPIWMLYYERNGYHFITWNRREMEKLKLITMKENNDIGVKKHVIFKSTQAKTKNRNTTVQ